MSDLASALVLASDECNNPRKNSQNPHLKNRFADLKEVLATVKPVLAKHGLAIMQLVSGDAGAMESETVTVVTSEPTTLPDGKTGPAKTQSTTTTTAKTGVGTVSVKTVLIHAASGQQIETSQTLRAYQPGTNEAQAGGIAITYARRYAILALLGIVGDEDGDGSDYGEEKPAKRGISEEGEAAAIKGMEALGAWWKALSDEGRSKVDIEALKTIAKGGAK